MNIAAIAARAAHLDRVYEFARIIVDAGYLDAPPWKRRLIMEEACVRVGVCRRTAERYRSYLTRHGFQVDVPSVPLTVPLRPLVLHRATRTVAEYAERDDRVRSPVCVTVRRHTTPTGKPDVAYTAVVSLPSVNCRDLVFTRHYRPRDWAWPPRPKALARHVNAAVKTHLAKDHDGTPCA